MPGNAALSCVSLRRDVNGALAWRWTFAAMSQVGLFSGLAVPAECVIYPYRNWFSVRFSEGQTTLSSAWRNPRRNGTRESWSKLIHDQHEVYICHKVWVRQFDENDPVWQRFENHIQNSNNNSNAIATVYGVFIVAPVAYM